jgi:REP element-mobilizing transposase RayT
MQFYELLEEGTRRFGHRIHAFCLMKNHVHLLVQVGTVPLSKIMQNIAFRYTASVNARYRRSGHLFQGRYKAILVDADTYLLELVRYIHLNPVRSGLVRDPSDYRWSSHHIYLGARKCPWLTTEWVLGMFAPTVGPARAEYKRFVSTCKEFDIRTDFPGEGTRDNRVLGGDTFLRNVMRAVDMGVVWTGTITDVIDAVCGQYDLTMKDLCSRRRGKQECEARALAALLIRDEPSLQLTDLASMLNRSLATLSEAAFRLEQRLEEDAGLATRLGRVKSILHESRSS